MVEVGAGELGVVVEVGLDELGHVGEGGAFSAGLEDLGAILVLRDVLGAGPGVQPPLVADVLVGLTGIASCGVLALDGGEGGLVLDGRERQSDRLHA